MLCVYIYTCIFFLSLSLFSFCETVNIISFIRIQIYFDYESLYDKLT